MAMRGRPPKPAALRAIDGGADRRPMKMPTPAPGIGHNGGPQMPVEPEFLSPRAKEIWHEIGPALVERGLLDVTDAWTFAGFCQSAARWEELEREFVESGGHYLVVTASGYPIQNPLIAMMNAAMREMKSYAQEFGMTPVARARLDGGSGRQMDLFDNRFGEFLQRRPA